jgi:hypothetical protein
VDLSLFRIKVFLPPLFGANLTAPVALREAIEEKPTRETGARGVRWHLGNVEELDDNGLYFALGRTSRGTIPLLDAKTGDFIEAASETAPYTHVILDVPSEVCAIAKRTGLAATVTSVGNHLARVLGASTVARQYGIQFEVAPLTDPEEFLRLLRSAYAITRFTVTFTRPNPFDVEQDFHKPMQRLTEEAGGEGGSTTLKGVALKEEPLENLTRSVASTGDDARARLLLEEGQQPVTRSLKGDTATISERTVDSQDERQSVLEKLRARYRAIRDGAA